MLYDLGIRKSRFDLSIINYEREFPIKIVIDGCEYFGRLVKIGNINRDIRSFYNFDPKYTGIKKHYVLELFNKQTQEIHGYVLTTNPPEWQDPVKLTERIDGDLDKEQWLGKNPIKYYQYIVDSEKTSTKLEFINELKKTLTLTEFRFNLEVIDYAKKPF